MKLGMIGARGHYGYVLDSLAALPQVRVVGLCPGHAGEDLAPLEQACRKRGDTPATFQDYRQMLDQEKPEILCVCGPFELHAQMTLDAFQRGIHVLCEKPVALTLADLERLKAAHAQSPVHFAGMMGMRYEPAFYTAWQLVRSGAIGTVRLISAQKSYKLGRRPEYQTRRDTYGGTIPWVGSHAIDWIYWFSGEAFRTVSAAHSRRHNRDHGECELTAVCQFTLSGETLAVAHLDYLRPDAAGSHGDDRVRVAGTTGVVEVRGGKVWLVNDAGEQTPTPASDRTLFGDFVRQVEGTGAALLGARDTWAVTEACLLARQAADEGRVLVFPE